MRDPDGQLEFTPGLVRRTIRAGAESAQFLQTALSRSLVQDGMLVDFVFHYTETAEEGALESAACGAAAEGDGAGLG